MRCTSLARIWVGSSSRSDIASVGSDQALELALATSCSYMVAISKDGLINVETVHCCTYIYLKGSNKRPRF